MDPKPHISNRSRLAPLLVLTLLALAVFAPSPVWTILLVGLGGAYLLAFLWVYRLGKQLSLRREMRFGWAQVGDRLEERFTLKNEGLLPALWVEVRDLSNLPGYAISRATGAAGMGETRWTTRGVCIQRGIYTLGPTILCSGDPFGLFQIEIPDSRSTNLMVTPPVVPLPEIQVAAGGRSGEGRPRPNAPERTVSAAGVREYFPGDSLRWIHWRTTARRNEPFVRLLDGTPAGDWWIVLDLDQSVQVGHGQNSTEEHAVILAASLADRGLRLRRAVGLAANSNPATWLAPRQGDGQRWELLRRLAVLQPGERPLQDLLGKLKPGFGKRSSLILITANTSPAWLEALLPFLWTGAAPTILLLDPATFGGRGGTSALKSTAAQFGIPITVIPRGLLDRPEARPGARGHWEWRVSPSGRAVAVQKPSDLEWKQLR